MVATANVKLYPDAYRKLKRIAKKRRWTLAVAVDEAIRMLMEREQEPVADADADTTLKLADGEREGE